MTRNLRSAITIGVPVAVVVLLVVAALLVSRRDPVAYADGTPEAAVQAYYQALIDHDAGAVYDLFSPALQGRCGQPTAAEIEYLSIVRVVLDEVTDDGDSATVRVSVTQDFNGGPLGTDESTTDETVQLARSQGTWLIDDLPWPYFSCQGKG